MHPEYSYFRACGLSLDAIETVEAEKTALARMKHDLCKKFGAEDMVAGIRDDVDRFSIISFFFDTAKPLPAGWIAHMSRPDFAMPPEGSEDAEYIKGMASLMERTVRRCTLEEIFDCGKMPAKNLPAGSYDSHFVRWSSILGKKETGYTRDPSVGITGSNGPCTPPDPIVHVKIGNEWFIRVPNDENGNPRVTPPDAEPRTFEEMIHLEHIQHHQTTRRPYGYNGDPGYAGTTKRPPFGGGGGFKR